MSYLVCHVQKFKASDIKGMQIHSQRERENSKNKDIERDKSYLNIDLHNINPINYSKKVKEIVKDGYIGERAIRKDAVLMTGTLISSDREFFAKLSRDEQIQFFKDSYDYLKNLYGEKNIVSATIHFDETTPHMHLFSVPLTLEGKLSSKALFTRKSLRDLQSGLPAFLKNRGFNIKRGIENSDVRHTKTDVYKKSLVVEVDKLENKVKNTKIDIEKYKNKLDKTRSVLEMSLEVARNNLDVVDDIKSVKTKETFLGANKSIKNSDYERIINQFNILALKNYDLTRNLKEISYNCDDLENQNMDLKDIISNLNFKISEFASRENDLRRIIELDFKKEIAKLTKEVTEYEKLVYSLSDEKSLIEKNFDERLVDRVKEETRYLKKENMELRKENSNFKSELKVFYRESNIRTEEQKDEFMKRAMIKRRNREKEK
ncbi:MAG: MobV family relaxase [Bacilli bacterium]